MIDRRTFLKVLSGAVAAISAVAKSAVYYTESESIGPTSPMRAKDGIEVIEGVQPEGADYYAVMVNLWFENRLVHQCPLRWTNYDTLKDDDRLKAIVKEDIERAIRDLQPAIRFIHENRDRIRADFPKPTNYSILTV